jgi:hypothetical protein
MNCFIVSASVNSGNDMNAVVKQSYFKGSHYLIKAVLIESNFLWTWCSFRVESVTLMIDKESPEIHFFAFVLVLKYF